MLSIGVSVGSKIDIGGHLLRVQAIVRASGVFIVSVDRGPDIVISDGKSVEILPGVRVQAGIGSRLGFQAKKSIQISRIDRE